ncbi:hypothetical protein [Sinorhizobium meliloti]|uniref:hypothetical protein n=1 Tax=Rhizobium meliloti TaxID=382 RepID=UPI000FD98FD4|nr:hypothetical protein [Sinorhizobium meliloti]RVH50670.1 hypothetical protein CN212_10380 [Sinorhizobium meliloti]
MTDNDFLDSLLTPEEIARRITASSGVKMTARTVWEKARRIGVAKKIGRSPLIHLSDVPRLLEEETRDERRRRRSRIRTGADALSILQKARKKRVRP